MSVPGYEIHGHSHALSLLKHTLEIMLVLDPVHSRGLDDSISDGTGVIVRSCRGQSCGGRGRNGSWDSGDALAVAMVEMMVAVMEVGCHATTMVVVVVVASVMASVVVWTMGVGSVVMVGLFPIVGGVMMGRRKGE